jgi:hypothetical protein
MSNIRLVYFETMMSRTCSTQCTCERVWEGVQDPEVVMLDNSLKARGTEVSFPLMIRAQHRHGLVIIIDVQLNVDGFQPCRAASKQTV